MLKEWFSSNVYVKNEKYFAKLARMLVVLQAEIRGNPLTSGWVDTVEYRGGEETVPGRRSVGGGKFELQFIHDILIASTVQIGNSIAQFLIGF